MKKKGLLKKIGIGVVVLLIIAAIAGGSGNKKDSSSNSNESSSTQVEQSASQSTAQQTNSATDQSAIQESAAQEPAPAPAEEPASSDADETLIRPEFKEAMDSYEAFFAEYVEFMQRMQADPTNADILAESADMLNREAQMLKEFDDWEYEEGMTLAESAYYLEVHSRIYAMLATVA